MIELHHIENASRGFLALSRRPWPVAPRPLDDEAFASWLGRLAARHRISVAQLWMNGHPGEISDLTCAGWLLFPPVDELVLSRLAALTHVGVASSALS
ncbi:TniQ family protein [Cupriavidus sp. SK-4]|uniref:TniQ family protein n=1 Tax=Cupriavidus sp. SK-4 TaxID=574750 RepID=UPI0035102F67